MLRLEDRIDSKEGREMQRAVAVKMVLQGVKTQAIWDLLEVSASFVSKWKTSYENAGATGLLLHYKGREGVLTEPQRSEIILDLKWRKHYSVEELRALIESPYGIVYQSKQSYYDLLQAAGMSWHKTQPVNPKLDEETGLLKREDIKKAQSACCGDHGGGTSCFY